MFFEQMVQEEGVPQGSVLSVTCFALAINTLPQCVCESVRASLYVDDFAVFNYCFESLTIGREKIAKDVEQYYKVDRTKWI